MIGFLTELRLEFRFTPHSVATIEGRSSYPPEVRPAIFARSVSSADVKQTGHIDLSMYSVFV